MKKLLHSLMSRLMISCEKAAFFISKSQDERLTCKEKTDMHLHLMGCKFCRRYKKDIDLLSEYLKKYRRESEKEVPIVSLSDAQKQRILNKISNNNDDNNS